MYLEPQHSPGSRVVPVAPDTICSSNAIPAMISLLQAELPAAPAGTAGDASPSLSISTHFRETTSQPNVFPELKSVLSHLRRITSAACELQNDEKHTLGEKISLKPKSLLVREHGWCLKPGTWSLNDESVLS